MARVLVVESVYAELKKRIVNGYYLPGLHLTESSLAEELKVSRVTLREALRRLVADDLVVQVPNRGVRVRQFTREDVIELYTVREPLEALAAKLAAEAKVKDLSVLQQICAESAKSLKENKYGSLHHRDLNDKFHNELARVAGNKILIKTLERLTTKVMRYQFMPFLKSTEGGIPQKAHEELLAAIKAGDGQRAESIMRQHIRKDFEFALSCCPNS